ncbi:MAG: hypothetical protein WCF60_21115 [Anaerobacillus sp.]
MKATKAFVSVVSVLVAIGILFLALHITPKVALRTHLFFMGYPKAAITTEIVDDEFHNREEKEAFEKTNTKAYTLTEPPTEKATQGELRNFRVTKDGYLYFADYLGEF